MHDCYCFHHFCTVIIYIYSLYNYITHKVSARWGAPLRPANLSGRAISTVGGLDEEEEPNKTFCLPFVAKGEPLKTLSLHCLLAAVRSAHFSVAPFLGTIQFFPLTLQCAEHWIFSKWFSLALFPGFWLAPLWISSFFFLALQCAEHWFIVGLTLSSTRVSCLGRVLTSRFCGCLSTPVDNFPAWLHVSKNLDLDFHFHQFCDCEIFSEWAPLWLLPNAERCKDSDLLQGSSAFSIVHAWRSFILLDWNDLWEFWVGTIPEIRYSFAVSKQQWLLWSRRKKSPGSACVAGKSTNSVQTTVRSAVVHGRKWSIDILSTQGMLRPNRLEGKKLCPESRKRVILHILVIFFYSNLL